MMYTLLFHVLFLGSCFIAFGKADPGWEDSKKRGKLVYDEFCVTCHRDNGTGFGKLYPPLAKSDYLVNNRNASIRGVKYGMQGEIVVNGIKYNKKMDPLGLTDQEVVDVMNYIFTAWGNQTKNKVTLAEVQSIQ